MSISTLPLSYCTNVHPGQTVEEVINGLQEFTIPARNKLGEKIAAGLWLPASAIAEIRQDNSQLKQLIEVLTEGDLVCYTLNTFPYGNFHSARVKENVYLPDWTSPDRLDYTIQSAEVLAELMPEGVEGSLSTVPLGFKGFDHPESFLADCIENLLKTAQQLDQLHDDTGRVLRLAIEPEPLCVLETTAEAIDFFKQLFETAEDRGQLDIAQRHLGVCYDVCHQSIEFEDVKQSIRDLSKAEIRINKVHITCALRIESPGSNAAAREQLANFVEQRYLHQTFASIADGVESITDLTKEFCEHPPEQFQAADEWRIHFHVPVHEESVGELKTTRDDLKTAIKAVADLEYAPHLEVETYTWNVLPGSEEVQLVDGLVRELSTTRELLEETS
ncbi:MAG: metabolite traffic protein EboE [Planctomicrobium sp.]|jgi:sugar phosphate isomerase/epimerase|nr:metabolite traffic protein EboE [Planctomicrobium sp.]